MHFFILVLTFIYSFFHEAKSAAVKSETIIVMIGLLRDRKTEVRAAAAGALMRYSQNETSSY